MSFHCRLLFQKITQHFLVSFKGITKIMRSKLHFLANADKNVFFCLGKNFERQNEAIYTFLLNSKVYSVNNLYPFH